MLAHIHIMNLGIIEDLEVDFEKGLNILTGETGAGKTLIIDAISMVLGNKVSKDLIRTGASKAISEALFFIDENEVRDKLNEKGFEGEEIILSREILNTGKTISKINGQLVTTKELSEVGGLIADLHGQFENQSLLNTSKHITLLDKFIGEEVNELLMEYMEFYDERTKIIENIKKIGGNKEQRERTMDFLRFQIDEIKEADLEENEDINLKEKRDYLANTEKILKNLSNAYEIIAGDDGVNGRLQYALEAIKETIQFDEENNEYVKNISEAYFTLEETGRSILRKTEHISVDEEELICVDERMDTIVKLKRKYGKTIEEIFRNFNNMETEYDELVNSEKILTENQAKLDATENLMKKLAEQISNIRKKYATELEKRLMIVLNELEMPKCRFEIHVNCNLTGDFYKTGMDMVEILFSSNQGEEVKTLTKTASGGETSRIMLALKNVLSAADIISVLIFDEIDTGVSGNAGIAIGEKMLEIAKSKQVLCITHLPTIVAKGNANFHIEKIIKENRTVTKIKKLSEEEVIKEIAEMISGGDITETAMSHAKEIRGR